MTFIVAARLFLGVGIALYGGLLLYRNRAQAVEQEYAFNRWAMLCFCEGYCAYMCQNKTHLLCSPFVDVKAQQSSVEDK